MVLAGTCYTPQAIFSLPLLQDPTNPTTNPTKSCRLAPMVRFGASIGRVMVRNPTTNPTSKNRFFMRKTRLMVGLVLDKGREENGSQDTRTCRVRGRI